MARDEFTVYIYANEYAYLKWLVLQKQDIETGGDLFGLWQNEVCAVVQFVLGPGRNCRRTTTSFHQDVSYLGNVGSQLTSNEGLCNLGEWHSHHRLGLAYPSGGDQNTVWTHMPSVSGGRFLVFIANIQGFQAEVGAFMFNSATNRMTQGSIKQLVNCSPVRHTFSQKGLFKLEEEPGQDWDTFRVSKLSKVNQRMPRSNKVGNLETAVACVCDIEEENGTGCCYCLIMIVSCVCLCFRSMFRGLGRCMSSALRWCGAGLVNLTSRCGRQPARYVCDMEEEGNGRCGYLFTTVSFSCVCSCFRSMFRGLGRCMSSAFRSCLAGLINLISRCGGQPARD